MPTSAKLAANAELAHGRALEVVREHGPAERAERLENITVAHAVVGNPHHLAAFQAEILAAFAEIIEGQERRIAELEEAAASRGPAKNGPKNGPKKGS